MTRGRRSEHSRDQFADLLLAEGAILMAERGHAGFSARELAKRIGYSAAMVLKAAGGSDALITAINTRTFLDWTETLSSRLERNPDDRIAALVDAYFDFAEDRPLLWRAIYEHRPIAPIPVDQQEMRGRLTALVAREVANATGLEDEGSADLAASLVATVHGHCEFLTNGSFALMGISDGRRMALNRVRDGIERGARRKVRS